MLLALPVLGQMYNEEVGKGFWVLSLSILGYGTATIAPIKEKILFYYARLTLLGFTYWYSIIDASVRAKK